MRKFTVIKLFLLGLVLILAGVNLKAQGDTLTIRQIFDLKVGDTLIYAGSEDISALTYPYGPSTANAGRWGFTVMEKDTSADSITYTYKVLGTGTFQQLSVYFLDSITTVNQVFFSYYNPSYFSNMFHWTGYGVSLYRVLTCDSPEIVLSCDMYPSINSLFQNRIVDQNIGRYFESGSSYTFMEKVGIFQASISGLAYFNFADAQGSGTIQLIYYHSDSLIWMDTLAYIFSAVNEVSSNQPNFIISPNPFIDDFNLETEQSNLANSSTINVYDLQSRLIYQQKLQTTNHKQQINLPNVAAGLYVVSVENPIQGVVWRGRLVKL